MGVTRLPYGIGLVKPGASTEEYKFKAGDVTPDVSQGTYFVNAASGCTITNFDGGELGQIICVNCNTAGAVVLQNSAGGIYFNQQIAITISSTYLTLGSTAGNITMANGEALWFVNNGTQWNCIQSRINWA